MFQQRQLNDVHQLVEVSTTTLSPGAVGNGVTVGVSGACLIGGISGNPATFAVGDYLQVYPSAAAACNGVNVSAAAGPTPGTAVFNFQNATGGSVTPVAGAKYTIIAIRITPSLI